MVPDEVDYGRPEAYRRPTPSTRMGPELVLEADRLRAMVQDKTVAHAPASALPVLDRELHRRLRLERDSSYVLQRTAETVWTSGWASGCHDFAVVAAALLRRLGRPVVFVETVHDSFLRGQSHHGHVFLEVLEPSGGWVLYDPTNSRIWNDYEPGSDLLPGGYHVMGRYGDPWEAGLSSSRDLLACMSAWKE